MKRNNIIRFAIIGFISLGSVTCKKLHMGEIEYPEASGALEQIPEGTIGSIGWVKLVVANDTVIYATVRAADGQVWLQQNLGSMQVATVPDDTLSYGGLYQWGRWSDGHEVRSPSNLYHGMPYTSPDELPRTGINPFYFNSAPNTWWNVSGTPSDRWHGRDTNDVTNQNGCDPCRALGNGWRLPYNPEWRRVMETENIVDMHSAFESNLKLSAAGRRGGGNGQIEFAGNRGFYWSSTTYSSNQTALASVFFENEAYDGRTPIRGNGNSVRCIKGHDGNVAETVPGVIVDHIPAYKRSYIGSPSMVILPNGNYIASQQLFGPNSQVARPNGYTFTKIYQSSNQGNSWTHIADIDNQGSSTLFVHNDVLYALGVDGEPSRNVTIRKSIDGGLTWTNAIDATSGILHATAVQNKTAPTPVVVHGGRIWRAMEDQGGDIQLFGRDSRAFMLSAPQDTDLLDAANWTVSNKLPYDSTYMPQVFFGWIEGNAVVGPDGNIVIVARVHSFAKNKERNARISISPDGTLASFNPSTGFSEMPGGSKKFTIRYDSLSGKYWALSNYVPPKYHDIVSLDRVRNTLALCSSTDLQNWDVKNIVVAHPDIYLHGYQYADWHFDGTDIVAVVRTSHDDGIGGAHSYHDSNYLTFHRVENFRSLTSIGP